MTQQSTCKRIKRMTLTGAPRREDYCRRTNEEEQEEGEPKEEKTAQAKRAGSAQHGRGPCSCQRW